MGYLEEAIKVAKKIKTPRTIKLPFEIGDKLWYVYSVGEGEYLDYNSCDVGAIVVKEDGIYAQDEDGWEKGKYGVDVFDTEEEAANYCKTHTYEEYVTWVLRNSPSE